MATLPSHPRLTRIIPAADSLGPFDVGFRIFDPSALRVHVGTVLRTDYTVTGSFTNGYSDDARITFGTLIPGQSVLTIESRLPVERPLDFVPSDKGLTRKLNLELARLTSMVGDVRRDVDRSFKAVGSTVATPFPQPGTDGPVGWFGNQLVTYAVDPTYVPWLNFFRFEFAGDGISNDFARLEAIGNADGLRVLGTGDYVATGTFSAQPRPKLFMADDATLNGTPLPFLAIAENSIPTLPRAHLFVEQVTSLRDDPSTVYIQRVVDEDTGLSNPKALRVRSVVNADTMESNWVLSAELDNYSNISGEGSVAVSGVANKRGLAPVFGGHIQAKDWNVFATPSAVTALIGAEVNTPAVGLDHPTANDGTGLRRGFDIIARTNEQVANWLSGPGNAGAAEIGVGVMIRTDALTDGYFRYGLVIDDVSQKPGNPNSIGTGLLVRTSGPDGVAIRGANTDAALRVSPGTPGLYGIVVQGDYSAAAIRIPSGENLSLSDDATKKMRYTAGADSFVFVDGTTERFAFQLNATPILSIAGTQVLGTRKTGWTAATGTATRSAFATGTVTTAQLAERVKALVDDLMSHGLIGA